MCLEKRRFHGLFKDADIYVPCHHCYKLISKGYRFDGGFSYCKECFEEIKENWGE